MIPSFVFREKFFYRLKDNDKTCSILTSSGHEYIYLLCYFKYTIEFVDKYSQLNFIMTEHGNVLASLINVTSECQFKCL